MASWPHPRLCPSSGGGNAFMMTPGLEGPDYAAFSSLGISGSYNIALAHELGEHPGSGDAAMTGGGGYFSYSQGWRFTVNSATWITVMSYPPGTDIYNYSNPDAFYQDAPTGTVSGANNAFTIAQLATKY